MSFKLTGIPEGVTAPSIVTRAADANALNVDVSAVDSARHGDFVLTLEAEGRPITATAKLVVRSTGRHCSGQLGLTAELSLRGSASAC